MPDYLPDTWPSSQTRSMILAEPVTAAERKVAERELLAEAGAEVRQVGDEP